MYGYTVAGLTALALAIAYGVSQVLGNVQAAVTSVIGG